MRIAKTASIIIEIVSALFIVLFLYTALSKLSDLNRLQLVIEKSPIIGDYAVLFSWLVPISEIITSIMLFIPRFRYWGLIFSLILMLIFTLYIGLMIAFAGQLPCSCGGVISQMSWLQHFFFNVFFCLIAVFAIWVQNTNKLFIAINRSSRIPV